MDCGIAVDRRVDREGKGVRHDALCGQLIDHRGDGCTRLDGDRSLRSLRRTDGMDSRLVPGDAQEYHRQDNQRANLETSMASAPPRPRARCGRSRGGRLVYWQLIHASSSTVAAAESIEVFC